MSFESAIKNIEYWDYECLLLFEQSFRSLKRACILKGIDTSKIQEVRDLVVSKYYRLHPSVVEEKRDRKVGSKVALEELSSSLFN